MEDTEDTDEKWEDEDEDMNEFEQPNTSVVEAWNNKFWMICSEIIENFIYLGSQAIAQNKEKLLEYKITHIINCSGDVC